MFLEDEDWNDDKANVPSPSAAKADEPSPNVKCKAKAVGKKSLMRTLQTLGSVPEWSSEQTHRGSDSDADTPHTDKKKKRRKKKRRRRGHADAEEGKEAEEREEAPLSKKSRGPEPVKKVSPSTTDKPQKEESCKPATDSASKLSRKQWKNKMKNKRKGNNKFKANAVPKDVEKTETDTNRDIPPSKGTAREHREGGISKELPTRESLEISKKAQLKKDKLRRLLQSPKTDEEAAVEEEEEEAAVEAPDPDPSASLRSRMEQRLDAARFRYINEALYSTSSKEAQRMFTQDQEAFWVYHRGYSAQVQRWPHNPVDQIIQFIKLKPASLVVADFGCGDCKIAKSVKNTVHSFDLVATSELVTACDMAHVPLKDGSVDIAVFCLSLMGTNLADFLKEANRVLKRGGFLKIAEVSSRFENVRNFTTALSSLGFKLMSKDTENTHFYSFDFLKTGPALENVKKFGLELKPCLYKKR
ncbi:unnamed protein product [Knipowitschia caucasica]|uniref:Ribosomal RNA-processing protein 8 n=1 Tax=Knipowitschia caucasica TaxID=637954 RepID=A0AAV2J3H5_KNICA